MTPAASPSSSSQSGSAWRVFDRSAMLAAQLATDVSDRLRAALAARGRASLLLSGGRSPEAFLHELAGRELDWQHVLIGLVDERWVEATHPDSNEGMIRRCLLNGPAARARLIGLKTVDANPSLALAELGRRMEAFPHPFDEIVLGMGDDGHTASLFADSVGHGSALDDRAPPAFVAVAVSHVRHARVSMNLAMLLDARHLSLLVMGPEKQATIQRALIDGLASGLPIAAVLAQTRVPLDMYWCATDRLGEAAGTGR